FHSPHECPAGRRGSAARSPDLGSALCLVFRLADAGLRTHEATRPVAGGDVSVVCPRLFLAEAQVGCAVDRAVLVTHQPTPGRSNPARAAAPTPFCRANPDRQAGRGAFDCAAIYPPI